MVWVDESAVVQSLEALLNADPDMAEGFLLAAAYCVAIRTEVAPREVVENLWKALPESESWPPFRDALLSALG